MPLHPTQVFRNSLLFSTMFRSGLLGLVFFACSMHSNGEKQKPTPSEHDKGITLRSTSNLVTVDVVVSQHGRPVTGIAREAFHVFEDGHEQEIKSFEEHKPASQAALPEAVAHKRVVLPPNVFTNEVSGDDVVNVLLLDALNTLVSDQVNARTQMINQVKSIPAGMRIGIFTLGSRLRLVQDISADPSALAATLESGKGMPTPSLVLEEANDSQPTEISGNEAASDALQEFQTEHTAQETDFRVRLTLDAMQQLVKYLSAVPGRKNVIWLSGSFPLTLDPDTSNNPFLGQRTYDQQLQKISNEMAASRIAVYPIDARGVFPQSMFSASVSGASYASGMRARTGRRTGGGGPTAFARDLSQFNSDTGAEHATMQQLAEDTGGYAFYSSNDLKNAIAAALESGSSYYTLTYGPENKKTDGKFRRISVKIPADNYHLSYRHGYFATAAEVHAAEDLAALIKPDAPAIQHDAPLASQILFKARVLCNHESGTKHDPAGLMAAQLKGAIRHCSIDYNIDVHGVSINPDSNQMFHAALELIAVVYNKNGKLLNVADQPFRLSLHSNEYDKLTQRGLTLHQEIGSPEGHVYLRLAIHDLTTNRLGSLEVSFKGADQTNGYSDQ